jgi:hypothetical protein
MEKVQKPINSQHILRPHSIRRISIYRILGGRREYQLKKQS